VEVVEALGVGLTGALYPHAIAALESPGKVLAKVQRPLNNN
jgi:hypothetical protein